MVFRSRFPATSNGSITGLAYCAQQLRRTVAELRLSQASGSPDGNGDQDRRPGSGAAISYILQTENGIRFCVQMWPTSDNYDNRNSLLMMALRAKMAVNDGFREASRSDGNRHRLVKSMARGPLAAAGGQVSCWNSENRGTRTRVMTMNIEYAKTAPERAELDAMTAPAVIEFGTDWCGFCRGAAADRTGVPGSWRGEACEDRGRQRPCTRPLVSRQALADADFHARRQGSRPSRAPGDASEIATRSRSSTNRCP